MASDKRTPNVPKTEQDSNAHDAFDSAKAVMEQPDSAHDVFATANQIMGAALNNAEDAQKKPIKFGDGTGGGSGTTEAFKGLPMRDLIGGPLIAAAEAQQNLAAVAWEFYQKIAFATKEVNGKKETVTRTLNFTVNRPVEQGDKLVMVPQEIQAPFIGLVPIPSLLIDRIAVDFQMEVTDTNVEKTSSTADASTKITAKGWWVASAEVTGKVSSSRENTRTTNQTAKYQVHVTASQQPQTEGLSKLMDIMASCIEPVAK